MCCFGFLDLKKRKKKKKLYLLIVDVEGIDGGYLVYDIDSGYCLIWFICWLFLLFIG